MTMYTTDSTEAAATDDRPESRYAGIEIEGERLLVYDRENHRAWLQSDAAVPVADAR